MRKLSKPPLFLYFNLTFWRAGKGSIPLQPLLSWKLTLFFPLILNNSKYTHTNDPWGFGVLSPICIKFGCWF